MSQDSQLTTNKLANCIFLKKSEAGMVPVPVLRSRSRPEPVGAGIFSRSRSRCEGPAPGSSSTLDKTEEMLNDILFVCFNID